MSYDTISCHQLSLFSAIPDDKYPILAQLCQIEQIEPNTVIFYEGEVGKFFYLIVHGDVSVSCQKVRPS